MTTISGCSPKCLNMNELPIERVKLNVPPLTQIADVLVPELSKNFEKVTVEVVQCPDLTQPPFNLTSEGLSGDEIVLDIGDLTNVIPEIDRQKVYNSRDLKQITASDPLFIIGPCAGPHPFLRADSECVKDEKMIGDYLENKSHIIVTTEDVGISIPKTLPNDETRFSFMANLYTSNGFKGEVLKISCEIRKGPLSYAICIREALEKHFGNQIIALGGVLFIENGKLKVHLMKPGLDKLPLKSEKELGKWVHMVDISSPVVGLGCIVSHDPGLNLRLQHIHLFSDHEEGGHFHYDVNPDTIKYTGYFSVAKQLIKVDQFKKDAPAK